MHFSFDTQAELAHLYRDLPSDRIRSDLAKGGLSLDARTVALKELARRGEPMPPSLSSDFAGNARGEVPARAKWIWLLVFIAAFAAMCLFGTSAHNSSDRGFLLVVIFLQALLLTGCAAGVASFARSTSVIGVVARIVMLLVLGVLVLGLSMCASFVRNGWLGG